MFVLLLFAISTELHIRYYIFSVSESKTDFNFNISDVGEEQRGYAGSSPAGVGVVRPLPDHDVKLPLYTESSHWIQPCPSVVHCRGS